MQARVPLVALALLLACRSAPEPVLAPSWDPEHAGRPLTHADCVRLAATWAPNAAAWDARRAAARAALEEARRLPNPHLDIGWEDFPLFGPAGVPLQTTASLLVALRDLAKRGRRRDAAAHELEAEEAELRAELATLARDVFDAYDDVVAARERFELERELVAVAEAQREATVRFVAAGERAALDGKRAEAELLSTRSALVAASFDARATELALAFALGFEKPIALALSEPLTEARAADEDELDELLAEAAAGRPELRATEARYAAERERLALSGERTRFLPDVGFGVRREGEDVRGVATIDVELPLFDAGGADRSAASARLLEAAAALRTTAHVVGEEVVLANVRLAAAVDARVRATELAAHRRALRESTARLFAAGESSYDELVLAHRDEVDARLRELEARRELAAASVALEHATGRRASPGDASRQ